MREILLITVCALSFSLNFISTKIFQTKLQKTKNGIYLYQFLFCLIASLCFYFSSGKLSLPCKEEVVYGIIFGVMFSGALIFLAKSFESGSMSLSGIIINMSLVLPILYSVIFLSEKMTAFRIIGIVMILISMVISGMSGEGKTKSSAKWIVFILIAFFTNGASAVTQKIFCVKYNSNGSLLFMAVAYLTSALVFLLCFFASRNEEGNSVESLPKLIGLSLAAGAGSCLGNGILSFLTARVDSAVLYPCVNGGIGIIVALISFAVFKEKPTAKKVVAIALGTCAIIVLNLV